MRRYDPLRLVSTPASFDISVKPLCALFVLSFMRLTILVLSGLLALQPETLLAAPNLWFHARFEKDDDPKLVLINIPFSAIERGASLAPVGSIRNSRIEINGTVFHVKDFRAIVRALETSEGAWVRVDRGNGPIFFLRRGGEVWMRCEQPIDEFSSQPVTRMPLGLAKSLVSGRGSQFNISAAIAALAGEGGEIVLVNGEETRARMWVDAIPPSRNAPVPSAIEVRR